MLIITAVVTELTPLKFPETMWLPDLFVDYQTVTVWLSLPRLLQLVPQGNIWRMLEMTTSRAQTVAE